MIDDLKISGNPSSRSGTTDGPTSPVGRINLEDLRLVLPTRVLVVNVLICLKRDVTSDVDDEKHFISAKSISHRQLARIGRFTLLLRLVLPILV